MFDVSAGYRVYQIVNLETGHVYIGLTIGNRRWQTHRYHLQHNKHSNPHFQNAWNKYGEHCFVWEWLDFFETVEEMNQAEIAYIAWFRALDLAYNIRDGGENGHHSPESRRKQSCTMKGRYAGNKNPMYGKPSAFRGKKHSIDTLEQMKQCKLGKRRSEETIAKIRLSKSGRRATDAEKEWLKQRNLGIGNPMFGKKHSDETKAKMRQKAFDRQRKSS